MPDITVWDGDRLVQIIDTKWKVLDGSGTKYGVSQADMYQMVAYAQRYGCGDITLLYPLHGGVDGVLPEFEVVDSGVRVRVRCVDLSGLESGRSWCDDGLINC